VADNAAGVMYFDYVYCDSEFCYHYDYDVTSQDHMQYTYYYCDQDDNCFDSEGNEVDVE